LAVFRLGPEPDFRPHPERGESEPDAETISHVALSSETEPLLLTIVQSRLGSSTTRVFA
jgi:hypothetical protein